MGQPPATLHAPPGNAGSSAVGCALVRVTDVAVRRRDLVETPMCSVVGSRTSSGGGYYELQCPPARFFFRRLCFDRDITRYNRRRTRSYLSSLAPDLRPDINGRLAKPVGHFPCAVNLVARPTGLLQVARLSKLTFPAQLPRNCARTAVVSPTLPTRAGRASQQAAAHEASPHLRPPPSSVPVAPVTRAPRPGGVGGARLPLLPLCAIVSLFDQSGCSGGAPASSPSLCPYPLRPGARATGQPPLPRAGPVVAVCAAHPPQPLSCSFFFSASHPSPFLSLFRSAPSPSPLRCGFPLPSPPPLPPCTILPSPSLAVPNPDPAGSAVTLFALGGHGGRVGVTDSS